MSDLLIKNMEMPKEGDTYGLHLVIYPNGEVWIAYDDKPITEAIEIPPHGRLIDADKFITELRATINKVLLGSLLHNIFVNDESVKQDTLDGINFVLDRLENEPTVLEAST